MTSSNAAVTWHEAVSLDELPTDRTGRCVEVAGRRLAFFRHAGKVHCLDDTCPHQGASLGEGVIAMTDVTCPWHGFHFDLATGENTDGIGEAGVTVHPTEVTSSGVVRVGLTDPPTD